jgi:exodeoxyribonuclease-1
VSFTFYWHDYETFGVDPSRDRPVQFAGLRTDADLNVIGEPLVVFCKPARDVLPQPEACLVTGITPQRALAEGVCEAEFIRQIQAELSQPGTCGVGYNTIRFDDEVSRYTLYRNFYDPYEREYKNGNSRWDIIDMLRLTYALRPEGINWPMREDGLPSFKLESLTEANGIGHASAHDALSDVEATIAVARMVKEKQPKLFEHVLALRSKQAVAKMLDVTAMKPVLHVSGKFGARRNNIGLVAPVALHPTNKSEVICLDLSRDPSELAEMSVEDIRQYLFSAQDQLPEGVQRPAIKTIRTNRCPVVLTPKLLDDAAAERLEIDRAQCLANAAQLRTIAGLGKKLQQVFSERNFPAQNDPDRMLYSGGFFGDADKREIGRVRTASADQLRDESFVFEDQRLPEMLFRYRARNYPESLTTEEVAQWEEYRFQYLTDPEAGASITMDEYLERIELLQASENVPAAKQAVLASLLDYSDHLLT